MADFSRSKRGLSQAFYREKLHEKHYGYPDLESFMVGFWEGWATSKGTHIRMPQQLPNDALFHVQANKKNTEQIPRTCSRCSTRGKAATAPSRSLTTATLKRQCRASRPRRSSCPQKRICTSREFLFLLAPIPWPPVCSRRLKRNTCQTRRLGIRSREHESRRWTVGGVPDDLGPLGRRTGRQQGGCEVARRAIGRLLRRKRPR